MKVIRNLNLKEFIWNSLHKLTSSFSILTVHNLGNGYIKCNWEISKIDNLRIEFSKSFFCAIRLFDISNNRIKNTSTCIMKEIEISKFKSSLTFTIPINKGVYYFELGYRKKDGQWRKLAYQNLNLGYRIKKVIQSFDNDNWFDSKIKNNELSLHEKAYKMSLNSSIGGSENISM
tara:strand:- start:127 stop:651 length:525 start_codon:yes stop_codon:yes gene_type:complete